MRINKARKARGVAGGVSGPGVERRHETGCLQGSGMGWSGAQCCAARIAGFRAIAARPALAWGSLSNVRHVQQVRHIGMRPALTPEP